MKNIISLSGLAASGKSTIGKLLAQKLKWQFISVGNFSRKFARENYDMNINEFQKLCKRNSKIDKLIDERFARRIINSDNLIVDYRLAYHFIKDTFHVFLAVSEEEAVKRMLKDNRVDEFEDRNTESVRKIMNKRNYDMRERFIKKYQTDFLNHDNYNLVINTDIYKNFSEIVDLIITNFKKYKNAHS
jgi:cytidylate kinase